MNDVAEWARNWTIIQFDVLNFLYSINSLTFLLLNLTPTPFLLYFSTDIVFWVLSFAQIWIELCLASQFIFIDTNDMARL